jgi:hypothetical protein
LKAVSSVKWISVNDRLPDAATKENMNDVLAFADGEQYVAHIWNGTWYSDGCTVESITHWMPLPEPPACGRKLKDCEQGECKHEKVFSDHLVMTNPPQRDWICKVCGQTGSDQVGQMYVDNYEYDYWKNEWHKLKDGE